MRGVVVQYLDSQQVSNKLHSRTTETCAPQFSTHYECAHFNDWNAERYVHMCTWVCKTFSSDIFRMPQQSTCCIGVSSTLSHKRKGEEVCINRRRLAQQHQTSSWLLPDINTRKYEYFFILVLNTSAGKQCFVRQFQRNFILNIFVLLVKKSFSTFSHGVANYFQVNFSLASHEQAPIFTQHEEG